MTRRCDGLDAGAPPPQRQRAAEERGCAVPPAGGPRVGVAAPMSASVDHIVPLSRGGEHSMANVQCAHLSCNSSKGDQTIEEISEVEAIITAIVGAG